MNQIELLMMMTVFGGQTFGGQGRGAKALKQAFPAMLGPAGFALGVLAARKELKQQDETNTRIIKQVVASGIVKDIKTLNDKLPALHAVFVGLPAAVQDDIFPRLPPDSTRPPVGSRKGERAAP